MMSVITFVDLSVDVLQKNNQGFSGGGGGKIHIKALSERTLPTNNGHRTMEKALTGLTNTERNRQRIVNLWVAALHCTFKCQVLH